jgi:hypothetical protein
MDITQKEWVPATFRKMKERGYWIREKDYGPVLSLS